MFHTHQSNLRTLHSGIGPATRLTRNRRRRLKLWAVEPLEGRTLLSTFTVNSLGDTGTGTGNSGDLRYVITKVDQAGGNNTINFSVTGTITLNSALPDLSDTTGTIDIEGPGASSLTVARSGASGTPDFRILTIDANTKVKIVGLTIADGIATAGGGLLIDGGTVTLSNVAVIDNHAVGTDGAAGANGQFSVAQNGGAGGSGFGGGIYLSVGSLTLKNDVIRDNVRARRRRRGRRKRALRGPRRHWGRRGRRRSGGRRRGVRRQRNRCPGRRQV